MKLLGFSCVFVCYLLCLKEYFCKSFWNFLFVLKFFMVDCWIYFIVQMGVMRFGRDVVIFMKSKEMCFMGFFFKFYNVNLEVCVSLNFFYFIDLDCFIFLFENKSVLCFYNWLSYLFIFWWICFLGFGNFNCNL